ncbi:MAG: toxin transporter, ATP-binding protein [Labilithrix sp.]|nr:toxin transporter, ATP-binding protein [Labilithrix sp.]
MRNRATAPVRRLLASLTPGARRLLAAAVAIGVLVRISVLVTARDVSRSELRGAALVSLFVAGALALQRLVLARLRVSVECDLHRAAAIALVEADVLAAPVPDLQRRVFEGEWQARTLLSSALPQILGDALVCVAVVPYVAYVLPARVLGVAGAALLGVLLVVVALRRATQRLQARTLAAAQEVYDHVLVGIEGRLELAARGGEAELRGRLEDSLARYAAIANRTGLRSAMAGRAPLAVGAAILAAAIALDPGSRAAIGTALLGDALLLAACLPPIVGAVVGAHEVFRSSAVVAPLVSVLQAARRPELSRPGGTVMALPAEIVMDRVSFRYEQAPVLEDVSMRWSPGQVLLVTGANGAGKSTLLCLLLGLRGPASGAITVGGAPLDALDVVAFRRRAVYLPQRPYLGEAHVAVRDAMRMARPTATDDELRAALARLEVLRALEAHAEEDALSVTVGSLSAGQRQRVALARVLLSGAALVVLDEPDAYLDAAGIALLVALVEELTASGAMVAVAAHSPAFATPSAVRVMLDPTAG